MLEGFRAAQERHKAQVERARRPEVEGRAAGLPAPATEQGKPDVGLSGA
jgi:hypothetical protein